jgi:Spy/CpxP family protein refolding chaperone
MIRTIVSLRRLCCGVAATAILATVGPLVGPHAYTRAAVLMQPTTQPGGPPGGPTTQPGGRQRGGGRQQGGRRGLTTFVTRYHDAVFALDGLTDDQKDKLNPIFDKAKTDADAVTKEMQDMAPEDRQDRMREFTEDLRGKVSEVLTDDQRNQLETKMQQMRGGNGGGGRGGRGGQGGPGGPGNPPPPPPGNGPSTGPGTMASLSTDSPVMADQAIGNQANSVTTSFTAAPGGAAAGAPRLQRFVDRLHTALAQINITPEQRPKVDAIVQSFTQRVMALRSTAQQARQDANAAENLRTQLQAIAGSARQELSQTLTPEQLERLRELMKASVPGSASALPTHGKPAVNAALVSNPGVDVGQTAPAFSLPTIDGKTASLSDFSSKPVVIVFACWTDPGFRDHGSALAALQNRFGSNASFLVIYRRELHPAGGWQIERNKTDGIELPQPADDSARLLAAQSASRKLALSMPMAVDSMSDQVAKAYGSQQSDAAVIVGGNGKVIYRQNNFQPEGLENALAQTLHN